MGAINPSLNEPVQLQNGPEKKACSWFSVGWFESVQGSMADRSEKGGAGRAQAAASGSSVHVGEHDPAFCFS